MLLKIKKESPETIVAGLSEVLKITTYFQEPAGGNIECDFSFAVSHEPAGGKIECDFSLALSHEPAGGKIECDFSLAFSHDPAGGKIVCEDVFTSFINLN